MKLLLAGGRQKDDAVDLEEWHRYQCAVIVELDCDRGHARSVCEYVSPPEALPIDGGSVLFKAATLARDRLYACTQTEVIVYALPQFERVAYYSIERFNDLHHVRPRADGSMLVASTGLDCILHVSGAGELLREWPVLPPSAASPWTPEIDYRKVATTKPHASHPNFVFELEGQIWATRFEQRDAVCVEDFSKRIAIDVERPHDGVSFGGELYFTTIDGHVVVADAARRVVVRVFDLNAFAKVGLPLGWCRGLHVLARDQVLVSFSRIRPTRIKDNLRWLIHKALGNETRALPTRVAHFDLAGGRLLAEWSVEEAGLSAIFSIHRID